MIRARPQALLWVLTTVLALALVLLAVLQARWAGRLWRAEAERLQHEVGAQLETLKEDLGHQLVQWNLTQQVNVDPSDPGNGVGALHDAAGRMSTLVRDVYLVRGEGDPATARWWHIASDGTQTPLADPPEASRAAAWVEGEPQLFPFPIDKARLLLRLTVPDRDTMVSTSVGLQTFSNSPQLLITLDRPGFDAWLDDLAAEHWGERSPHLRWTVRVSNGDDETLLFGAPAQDDRETVIGAVQSTIDLREAIGESLSRTSDGCAGGACDEDSVQIGHEQATVDATAPIFLRFPSTDRAWQIDVQILRAALDPHIRELWVRNLAIGFVALAVLAVAVVLLVVLASTSQRLARAQFDFVNGVSHELRTPLSVLRSAAANLEDGLVSGVDQNRRYGRTLRKEVDRLQDLVDRILGFTRAQTVDEASGAADLAESVARVCERLRAEIADRGVTLDVRVPEDLPPVAAQAWMLDSVLQNLLSNALKYGGNQVRIEAENVRRRRRPAVALSVRDWGPGLSRAERRRVFEPFFRGRLAREQQLPGAGLGLSWIARLAQRTGGRLIAESHLGQGSRFGVVLPAAGGGES